MMQIQTNAGQKADFYIARVGYNAGKPMWEAYTSNNSFAVVSDDPQNDFAKVMCLYVGRLFDQYTLGTCQQSIRIQDARAVVQLADGIDQTQLEKLAECLQKLEEITKLKKLFKSQTVELARSLVKSGERRQTKLVMSQDLTTDNLTAQGEMYGRVRKD